MNSAPQNPSGEEAKLRSAWIVARLNRIWGFSLEIPAEKDSPIRRSEQRPSIQQEIVHKIIALSFKNAIDPLIKRFDAEAEDLYSGWVNKPKAERGVVPEKSRHAAKQTTEKEKVVLVQCLLEILTEQYELLKTPRSKGPLVAGNPNTNLQRLDVNDTAIPLQFPSKARGESKRLRDQQIDIEARFKKPKLPEQTTDSSRPQPMQGSFGASRSAHTSFVSEASSIFSNSGFNRSNKSLLSVPTQYTPQSSAPERQFDTEAYGENPNTSFESKIQSSDCEGAPSFDADVVEELASKLPRVRQRDPVIDDELSQEMDHAVLTNENVLKLVSHQDLGPKSVSTEQRLNDSESRVSDSIPGEDKLRESLQGVFPHLPPSLRVLPICAIYEVTRVFLHVGVPLNDVRFPSSLSFRDYDKLWKFLKNLPQLEGKVLPERCSRDAWDAALGDFSRGSRAVYMTGSLRYNMTDESAPLFRFRLEALRLDASHRLGRRFGHDRFLEIDMPSLTGRKLPKILEVVGERGPEVVTKWLVDEHHHLLERLWKPFHIKLKDRKDRKAASGRQPAGDPEPLHRLYFFATDGRDFRDGIFVKLSHKHMKMPITALLDCIRPTEENDWQSYLKLFARTSLALSRNTPTVTLEMSQIRYKDDILCGTEVMTDGAGRVSYSLALKITQILGLLYCPSGFQGRFGEAKGFWSVDFNDRSGEDWIEIYASQRKWIPSSGPNGSSEDPSNRTFEVLKCSGPLRSADLNLQFLPLLMDRAKCPKTMRKALSKLLEEGLAHEIATLQAAMDSPQSFRKWVRDNNSNVKERLKAGAVAYCAGLPTAYEERLNVLLDVGFDPKRLRFIKELATKVFNNKCEDLKKRLNITVGRSTYVYMIPDFYGVLEGNEVYIDFSGFKDDISGHYGALLNGTEVLVARSPAHYVSDMQKVKVVSKVELMGLKDVIVFSTKGNPSLAAKLSGGDYDGDIAWVCWDPSLVENFENAEVPEFPDLLKEGYLRKDSTTYKQLVAGHADPTSTFLQKSFAFNMKQPLLGICTNFKEKVCYTQGSVNTRESVFLSTLLSYLVDQAKQGYIFTDQDWTTIVRDVIKLVPRAPDYKEGVYNPKSGHIVDYLMWLAQETIEPSLTDFHKGLPEPPQWDDDLVACYKSARELAEREPQWKRLLDDLDADLKPIKLEWNNRRPDESKSEFVPFCVASYEKFRAIVPHEDNLLKQSLLPGWLPDPDVSSWALLKASALFAGYKRTYVSKAVWYVAGRQLAQLKAMSRVGMVCMASHMYVMLKPDASFVKLLRNEEAEVMEFDRAPSSIEEVDDMDNDD